MWRAIYHELRRWVKASRAAGVRTEVTVETERIWIIRKSRTTRGWCAECGREVDMVGLNEARVFSGENAQSLTAQPMLVGNGDSRGWHLSKVDDGSLLMCLESLRKTK